MKRLLVTCLLLLVTQIAIAQGAQTPDQICASAAPAADPATRQFSAPDQVLQPGVDYRAIFCTDVGPIYVDLFEQYTPTAVNSLVFLAQKSYYNNTTFHRVIQDFMAQGGDPTATGGGTPGYSFNDEFVGFLHFDRPGYLAMANSGPNTNGSQFFITTAPSPNLDYQYTIFGQVLEGQENVSKIRVRDPQTDTQPGTALNTVVIVTDPTTVSTTHQAPTPATRDDFQKVIDNFNSRIPQGLSVDDANNGIYDTAQVSQYAPDAMRGDYAAFLVKYHHDYRVAHGVNNTGCDLSNNPFIAIRYTLDHFDTPQDAQAALTDGFLDKMEQVNGYTAQTVAGLDYPVYTQSTSACNQAATKALTFWQRGHFVATVTATFPTSRGVPADRWLQDLVGISTYERIFTDQLRAELP